jgi:hypothetical protein
MMPCLNVENNISVNKKTMIFSKGVPRIGKPGCADIKSHGLLKERI